MACHFPLTGYYARDVNVSGKRSIVFNRNRAFSPIPVQVGCGQCTGCRLENSRQWAMRCVHENSLHMESSFITLTYDDAHLPYMGSLDKPALSLFVKRLHNRLLRSRGYGVRWYGCGEYGEDNFRPHYHALIFGWAFPDRKFYKHTRAGLPLYVSEELRELWPFGHNTIGDVTFESAAYCARYVMKKVTGDLAEDYYQRLDLETGELVQLTPEFTNMSRRPGIAYEWFKRYYLQTYRHDNVAMNGKLVRPPRYYDTRFEALDAKRLGVIKRTRRRRAMKHRENNTPERRQVRETVAKARLALSKRDLR